MAKAGSVAVATFAIVLGLVFGFFGISIMIQAGSFAEGESHSSSGILGIGASSGSSASVNTPAWVGLLLALVGAAALLFGLRGLFVTFEGRGHA